MNTNNPKYITIVTGASKGIGKAIALRLADNDTLLVCISKSDQKGLLETVESIKDRGHMAYPILCDVSSYENVSFLYEEIKQFNLPIEYIINNAGISITKLFTDTSPNDWKSIMDSNINSIYNICHQLVNEMIQRRSGHIINISSIWGVCGASMEVAYSTSKAAVNGFTRALGKELGPSQVKVNAIACGLVNTDMNRHLSLDEQEALIDEIPMCRYATSDEVAEFVYGLIHHAPYLTGQVITYDGGWI